MKKVISVCFFAVLIGVFAIPAKPQTIFEKASVINKEFWLKVALPFASDCKIMISDEGIYSPKNYCKYIYDTSDNRPVSNGTKIKILSFKKRQKSVEIKFSKIGENDFTKIHLKSEKDLENLFKMVFSDKAVEEADDSICEKGISKMQILQCWGFPSSITKSGKREIYEYGLEFGGKIQGYDMATIELEDNIVVSIKGLF